MRALQLLGIFLVCQGLFFIAPFKFVWALCRQDNLRAFEILKGYDLLANPVFNGVAGEYISQRANRGRQEGSHWACVLCRMLDKLDPGHCSQFDTKQ